MSWSCGKVDYLLFMAQSILTLLIIDVLNTDEKQQINQPLTDSVLEYLGFLGEVDVDDVVKLGYVQTPRPNVRDNHHPGLFGAERLDVLPPRLLVQVGVAVGAVYVAPRQHLFVETRYIDEGGLKKENL